MMRLCDCQLLALLLIICNLPKLASRLSNIPSIDKFVGQPPKDSASSSGEPVFKNGDKIREAS